MASTATPAAAASLSAVSLASNGGCGGDGGTSYFSVHLSGSGSDFQTYDRYYGGWGWADEHIFYVVDANDIIIGRAPEKFRQNTSVSQTHAFPVSQRPTVSGNFSVILQDESDSSPDQALGATIGSAWKRKAIASFDAAALDPDCVPDVDIIAPTVSVPGNISVSTDSGEDTAIVTYSVTASDNLAVISGPSRTSGPASGATFPLGVTTVTHTAADAAGNIGTGSFTVTVTDGETPIVAVPSNIIVGTDVGQATAAITYSIGATDNVGLVSGPTPSVGSLGGGVFPLGTTTVSVSATDAAGNTDTKSFTVTVSDDESPVIAKINNATQNSDAGQATGSVTFSTIVSDNTGETPTPVFKIGSTIITSPHDFAIGETTVTIDAKDSANNEAAQQSFKVTISDSETPVIGQVSDITQVTDTGMATASVAFAASVTDNSGASLAPVFNVGGSVISSPHIFPIGDTIVTVDAKDSADNAAVQTSFKVTVSDVEIPVLNPIGDIAQNTDAGKTTADVTFTASVTDNSSNAPIVVFKIGTAVIASPHTFEVGAHTVTVDASDDAGNKATQISFKVTITDTTPPPQPSGVLLSVLPAAVAQVTGFAELGSQVTVTFPDGSKQIKAALSDGSFTVVSAAGMTSGDVLIVVADAAGNTSPVARFELNMDTTSPQVEITGAPADAAGITPFNIQITFTEEVLGFEKSDVIVNNARLSSFGGSLKSYHATVTPTGNGAVSISIPENVVHDVAGNGNFASNAISVKNVTVEVTQEKIAQFIQMRTSQLISNQPTLSGLLTGGSQVELNANVTRGAGNLLFRSSPDHPVWARLSANWTSDGSSDSRIVFGAVGVHRKVLQNLLIGALVEFDHLKQTDGKSQAEGTGWLFGPYFATKMANHPLFFEGRLLYGTASNRVTPFGTYTDTFKSERWLAQFGVQGALEYGATSIYPNLQASYASDHQRTYTDGLGNNIPAQGVNLGEMSIGVDFATPVTVKNGRMELTGGLSGVWSHTIGKGAASSVVPTYEGGRAKANLGVAYTTDRGALFSFGTYYDGIGVSDYQSVGVDFLVEIKF